MWKSRINRAKESGSWDLIRKSAHTVKGSGSTFGHPELARLGKSLCDVIDQGRLELAPALLDQLIQQMEQMLLDEVATDTAA